ncbi:MAG: phage major capsid protein, partial [Pisciglobus halotolerans]|nr:phage major capsid protein [Pisciglobus halotolerans]
VYPEKDAETDELTFADSKTTVKELSKVMKDLSTKEGKKKVTIDGKVVMLVNPSNAWSIKAQHTTQTANGLYVTALPFNIRVVESEFVKADTVIAFVNDRYDAYVAGGIKIKKFDQTLALEDCLLYTAKQFAYGKAEDNNAAKVYTLNIGTPLP